MTARNYGPSATLSLKNAFSFVCPIFDTEVQMRGCVLLQDRVYTGRHIETRRGCQACISASKCPANEIIKRLAFGKTNATEHCSSNEPKVGKLPVDVLEVIAPVVVDTAMLNNYQVPSNERLMIDSSRDRIEAQIKSAPHVLEESRPVREKAPVVAKPNFNAKQSVASAKTTSVNKAASTGDLSAAINAA